MTRKRGPDQRGDTQETGQGRGGGRARGSGRGSSGRSRGTSSLSPAPQNTSPPVSTLPARIGGAFAMPAGFPPSPPCGGTPASGGSERSVPSTFVPATASQTQLEGGTASGSSGKGRSHQFPKINPIQNPADRILIHPRKSNGWIVRTPVKDMKTSSNVVGEVAAIMKQDWRGSWYTIKYLRTMASKGKEELKKPLLEQDKVAIAAMQQIAAWENGIEMRFRWDSAVDELVWVRMRKLIASKLSNMISQFKLQVKEGRNKTEFPTWTDGITWNEMVRLMAVDECYSRASAANTENRNKHGPIGTHKTGRLPHEDALSKAKEKKGEELTLEENISVRYGAGDKRVPLVQALAGALTQAVNEIYGPDETNPERPRRIEDAILLLDKDQQTYHNRVRLVPWASPADMGLSRTQPREPIGIQIQETTRERELEKKLEEQERELRRLQRIVVMTHPTENHRALYTAEDHEAVKKATEADDLATLTDRQKKLYEENEMLEEEMCAVRRSLHSYERSRRMQGFPPSGVAETSSAASALAGDGREDGAGEDENSLSEDELDSD